MGHSELRAALRERSILTAVHLPPLQIDATVGNGGRVQTLLGIIRNKDSSTYEKFYQALKRCGEEEVAKKLETDANGQPLLSGTTDSSGRQSTDGTIESTAGVRFTA